MQISGFQKLAAMIGVGQKRVEAEYEEFFKFYRTLVELTDSEVAKAVGKTAVTIINLNGAEENWTILLTATDYLFWKEKIAVGIRFKFSFAAVKAAILKNMTAAAEKTKMTFEERKQLLALLDEDEEKTDA